MCTQELVFELLHWMAMAPPQAPRRRPTSGQLQPHQYHPWMRIAMRILLVSSVSPELHRSIFAADTSMAPPPLSGGNLLPAIPYHQTTISRCASMPWFPPCDRFRRSSAPSPPASFVRRSSAPGH